MRAIIISLFCCFAIGAIGQTRFNQVYDRDEDVSGVNLSYLHNTLLYTFGRRTDLLGNTYTVVYVIDSNGDTAKVISYNFDSLNLYFSIAGAYGLLDEHTLLLAGTTYISGYTVPLSVIYNFNFNTEELTIRTFGDTVAFETAKAINLYNDKIYLFSGVMNPSTNRYAYKIYQTDTLGNLLWDTIYGMPNKGLEMRHATIDSQGNCWIGGILNNTTQTYVNHIVKFNPQWQKVGEWTYGEPTFGGYVHFEEINADSMLICGAIAQQFDSTMAYSAIINQSNQLQNLFYYPDANSFASNHLKALFDTEPNTAIFLGTTYNSTYHKLIALLRKINYLTGEVIWEHRYAYNEQEHHQVYDLTQAPDGGFYIVGSAINFAGNQDVWVVKTDADGCLVENCLVGQEEVVQKVFVSVLAYPNPFTNTVTIELGNLPTTANVTLNYINAQGTVVSTQQLGTLRSTTWQAPIAGLYAATVWVDGMYYGSTLLVAQ